MASTNPRKWRYTWESLSHTPILKLFLFAPSINPNSLCFDLNVDLQFEKSILLLSWTEQNRAVSLVVPLPRVLVDLDGTLNFRALDDHIEVKIALLLPVDHPIVSNFVSETNFEDEFGVYSVISDYLRPLLMESDYKALSSKGRVDFYCRNCSFKLTKGSIVSFSDMPSDNWREAADNWFGACCCSFGGVSEKLVAKYVRSCMCKEGTCLLTSSSITVYKDDLVEFTINRSSESTYKSSSNQETSGNGICPNDASVNKPIIQNHEESIECHERDGVPLSHQCCVRKDEEITRPIDLQQDQKSFLNYYLGNVFVFKSSSLSKEVDWVEFKCPECSSLLGAYPCVDGREPLDGGIRLLKCYTSSCLPVGSSDDLFRKYTLERMFAYQLGESAKDELSFRTAVKDTMTKSAMLQVVLVNPNSWCSTGFCVEGMSGLSSRVNLLPVVKVLFSDYAGDNVSKIRMMQEWETKNQAEEVYMFTQPIANLTKALKSAKDSLPPSFSSSHHGFSLSSIPR